MEPGKYYHIYNRGNNRENIFIERENYRYFLRRFNQYVIPYVDVLSYCLMPNHFHFLVRINENGNVVLPGAKSSQLTPIEKAMRDFFISYAKSFNKRYDRTGSLFQYKFKRKEVVSESYLIRLIGYIHYNPVRSRLCKGFSEWEFSSYNAIVNGILGYLPLMDVTNWLFDGREDFIRFHEAYCGDFGV